MGNNSVEERLARLERLEDLISIHLGRIEGQVQYLLMQDGLDKMQFEQRSPKLAGLPSHRRLPESDD